MRRLARGLFVMMAGAGPAIGAEEVPPPPVAVAPQPPPAPPLIAYPVTLRPEQSRYGPYIPPSPAQRLAMAEAQGPVFASDPGVAGVAAFLERLTSIYVEDAPRIAAITIGLVQQIRATNQECSPVEVLAGALRAKRPPQTQGDLETVAIDAGFGVCETHQLATCPEVNAFHVPYGVGPIVRRARYVPRQFERFAAQYKKLRIDERKDHESALSLIP
jgi:hypothetical protein